MAEATGLFQPPGIHVVASDPMMIASAQTTECETETEQVYDNFVVLTMTIGVLY